MQVKLKITRGGHVRSAYVWYPYLGGYFFPSIFGEWKYHGSVYSDTYFKGKEPEYKETEEEYANRVIAEANKEREETKIIVKYF